MPSRVAKKETAEDYAEQFNIRHPFDDEQDLIACPEVDLVAVLTPGPEHARLAKAVIAGGKDVYSEWPLSTTTAESQELLSLAEAKASSTSSVCNAVMGRAHAT
ncbi:MAG: putative oxidoreductase [Chthoniobacteraceae bacterium]|nr:putative oxidoreductase [Chthoniobacteraceae bacterium]